MTRIVRWLGLLLGVLLIATGGVGAQAPTPQVNLQKMSYAQLNRLVRDNTGKVVVVDVWATNCRPCLKGLPKLLQMHKELASRGMMAITVNIDDPSNSKKVARARELLGILGATSSTNVLLDVPEGEAFKRFGINEIPYVVVFDRGNRIAMKLPEKGKEGPVDYEALRARIEKLLEAK